MFAAGYATGNELDISYLLSLVNLTITTGELGLVIPEFITKYGNNTPVNITASFADAPSTSTIAPDGQGVTINARVQFGVNGDLALAATMDGIKVHSVLSSTGGKLFGKIDTHTLGTWKDFSTTLTNVTMESCQAGLQQLIDKYSGIANTALAAGIVIPKVFGITVTDVDITFSAGLVGFGASIIPPQFASEVGEALVWLQEESMFYHMASADPQGYEEYLEIQNSPVYEAPEALVLTF